MCGGLFTDEMGQGGGRGACVMRSRGYAGSQGCAEAQHEQLQCERLPFAAEAQGGAGDYSYGMLLHVQLQHEGSLTRGWQEEGCAAWKYLQPHPVCGCCVGVVNGEL